MRLFLSVHKLLRMNKKACWQYELCNERLKEPVLPFFVLLPFMVHLPSPKTVSSRGPVSQPNTSSASILRRNGLVCLTHFPSLRKTGPL
jgi:hypothetical protein